MGLRVSGQRPANIKIEDWVILRNVAERALNEYAIQHDWFDRDFYGAIVVKVI